MILDVARAKIVKLQSSFANLAEPHQININHTSNHKPQTTPTTQSPYSSAFPQFLLRPFRSHACHHSRNIITGHTKRLRRTSCPSLRSRSLWTASKRHKETGCRRTIRAE